MEQSKEVQLAYEIATTLDDLKSIDWHIGNSHKFPESLLRETLQTVLNGKNVRSRVRYYNYLLQRHGGNSRA